MRLLVAATTALFLTIGLAGCLDDPTGTVAVEGGGSLAVGRLEVFPFNLVAGMTYGAATPWGTLVRLANPTSEATNFEFFLEGGQGWVADARALAVDGDDAKQGDLFLDGRLAGGESTVVLVHLDDIGDGNLTMTVEQGSARLEYTFGLAEAGSNLVEPGHSVETFTVGVWINGTSFYTNWGAFHEAPGFPRGYPAGDFGGDPLPIYVYDDDRAEQPPRSKDNCEFTTITGYNELLKMQQLGASAVRFLEPEEAYTVPGAEDHFLYGEPLIFLNYVVGHGGDTVPITGDLPQPLAPCFHPNNALPPGVPPLPIPGAS
ncbi:MAG: hypothetical protein ACPGQL_10200 [Thermoplasmatota archaeon]